MLSIEHRVPTPRLRTVVLRSTRWWQGVQYAQLPSLLVRNQSECQSPVHNHSRPTEPYSGLRLSSNS